LRNKASNVPEIKHSETRSSDYVKHLMLALIKPEYQPIFAEACLEGRWTVQRLLGGLVDASG